MAATFFKGIPSMLAAVLLTGCTMCPDPFDYSGPVPNGSPPQNDFRARSNGILPLSAAAVAPAAFTKADEPAAETVAKVEFPTDVAQPLAAADDTAAADESSTAPEPTEAADESTAAADSAPETAPPASPAPLAESPGWRPRR